MNNNHYIGLVVNITFNIIYLTFMDSLNDDSSNKSASEGICNLIAAVFKEFQGFNKSIVYHGIRLVDRQVVNNCEPL